jgi:ribosomal protein L11 methyltransferase
MRGDELPSLREIQRAIRRWPHRLTERQVSDDWRERRLAEYEPNVIAGRLVVRPDWAPAPTGELIDVALSESAAFGVGAHPTTRTCLEQLLELDPRGPFADLGCGTGVLAIAAAKLGWSPVTAVDLQPSSVEATEANARANQVVLEARVLDLASAPPPAAVAIAANVPAGIHERVADSLVDPLPAVVLLSGFVPAESTTVIEAYARQGYEETREVDTHGWVVAVLERP